MEPIPACPPPDFSTSVCESRGLFSLQKTVVLMGLAAWPERPHLAAAHRSENMAAIPELETGPVNRMSF